MSAANAAQRGLLGFAVHAAKRDYGASGANKERKAKMAGKVKKATQARRASKARAARKESAVKLGSVGRTAKSACKVRRASAAI